MGFEEDAIAAAEAARRAAAAAAKEAADAELERIALNTAEAIIAPWFTRIGVDPTTIDLTITNHTEEWRHGGTTYNDNTHYSGTPATTDVRFYIQGHEFQAWLVHNHELSLSERENGFYQTRVSMRVDAGAREPGEFMPVNSKEELGEAILKKQFLLRQGP